MTLPRPTIESVILQHSSRGMNLLRQFMPSSYCLDAAKTLLDVIPCRIAVCTGFHCFDSGETDGPVGSVFLAKALLSLGSFPIIVTDKYSIDFFNDIKMCRSIDYDTIKDPVSFFQPFDAFISIERCGRSDDGLYHNMKGVDITKFTSPIDELFLHRSHEVTIGIGDGGNEIGMGNYLEEIEKEIYGYPSCVKVDHLIAATVSNWGAYGLITALSILTSKKLLPEYEDVEKYLYRIVDMGAVDGIYGGGRYSTDGFDLDVEKRIINDLKALCG